MRRLLIGLVAVCLVIPLLTVGCRQGTASETPSVFTMANNVDPMGVWDPSDAFAEQLPVLFNLYETLLLYDPAQDKCTGVLATDWSVSPDGLTWTFHLRQGVKFHCGHEFTSADVKYDIERTQRRNMGAAFIWSAVQSIDAPDPYTVVLHLSYPCPMDLTMASAYAAFIFCSQCAEAKGDPALADWFNQGNDLGTGPYMMQSWKLGDQVIMTKFDDYWRGWEGNHFDKVVLKVVPETGTARQMLEAGEVDYVRLLPFEDVEALKKNPAFNVTATPGFQNVYIAINTLHKPLDNKLVRQAIAYTVPYQDIVDKVMFGYATQATGPVPKGMWGHFDDLKQYTYDLDKAKGLLAQAGYPNGGFTLVMTIASGDENHRKVAELWKSELAKVGITLDIRTMPFDAQWELAKSPDVSQRQDLYLYYYWPDVCSPQTYFEGCFVTQTDPIIYNLAYYSNPEVDELVYAAWRQAGTDRQAAAQTYKQVQERIIEDCPMIFLYDMQNVRVMSASIKGFVDNPAYPYVIFAYNLSRETK